jgi:two-component system chemotaxis response regulator CheY
MLRVLIIDDSLTMRSQLRKLLLSMSHEVIGEAENGFEGVQKYIELAPDFITLDLVMPQMDGFTALAKILEFDPKAKVLMVSSAATQSNVIRAREMGALGFLGKPVEKDSLALAILEIDRIISKQRESERAG